MQIAVYLRLAVFSVLAGMVLALVPDDAAAHASLVAEPSVELSLDTSDGEAHCHGAVECVVTFFIGDVVNGDSDPLPRARYDVAAGTGQSGLSMGRDPPVPIRER
ncbi:hypothetical protein [Pseudaestuariivita atlantica]|uniref:Uncharacterized protein n=1 Tax=Pseudaestuariivita atlantica TaxID=1317121 RepID=A0A0L1JUH0_9RHOB|nr:hypothetical protein [Pseudaestuariivita atlantica]KNG95400.1 hypothetical protein ATO11_01975 [Pseudaestuariivita atlantica]